MKMHALEHIPVEGSISLKELSAGTGAQDHLLGSLLGLEYAHGLTPIRASTAHGCQHGLSKPNLHGGVRAHEVLASVTFHARDLLPTHVLRLSTSLR